MALNPEKTADVLQVVLNEAILTHNWGSPQFTEQVIELAENEDTTVESFVDWLMMRMLTYLQAERVDINRFKARVTAKLKKAEIQPVAVEVKPIKLTPSERVAS